MKERRRNELCKHFRVFLCERGTTEVRLLRYRRHILEVLHASAQRILSHSEKLELKENAYFSTFSDENDKNSIKSLTDARNIRRGTNVQRHTH